MERQHMKLLEIWKDHPHRKPLILEGVRQCGKTWLVREFGRRFFKRTAYISLQDNERMADLFAGSINPDRLIPALALESGVPISPDDTLIILDEVQEVPRALTSLKYFNENAPEYAVIATGSSLGIAIHPGTSFPVGKVEVQRLYPLSFAEFLRAKGEEGMAQIVSEGDLEMMRVFHDRIRELLRYYLIVGGMPEVVRDFVETYPNVDFKALRQLQEQIVLDYREDFSKHLEAAPRGLPLRLGQVWDSIPVQLARENKKFVYGAVRSGARGRDFDLAIQWLIDTSLVLRVSRVNVPEYPLKVNEDLSAFKLYLCDVGLLCAMMEVDPAVILDGVKIFGAAKGALAEQFVCQEIMAAGGDPYYWAASNSSAELDFLLQAGGEVLPLEVKSGETLTSRSLKASIKRFGFHKAYRFSALPPRHDGAIEDLPLYAIGWLVGSYLAG